MVSLTPEQIADILFQEDNRVTAGILDRRSTWATFRDDKLSRENGLIHSQKDNIIREFANAFIPNLFLSEIEQELCSTAHIKPIKKIPLRIKLSFAFAREAKKGLDKIDYSEFTPHPKSLKKAMLELRNLGFSAEQIYYLSNQVRRIPWDLERRINGTSYAEQMRHDANKDQSSSHKIDMVFNDDGFLGAVIVRHDEHGTPMATNTDVAPDEWHQNFKISLISRLEDALKRYPNILSPASRRIAKRQLAYNKP